MSSCLSIDLSNEEKYSDVSVSFGSQSTLMSFRSFKDLILYGKVDIKDIGKKPNIEDCATFK